MFTVRNVGRVGVQTLHAFLKLFTRNFFLWLHVETISDFLFSKFYLIFVFQTTEHIFYPPAYDNLFRINPCLEEKT